MPELTPHVVVVALGNPLLGDEGVGPKALARLLSEYRFPESVALIDGGTSGLSLVPIVNASRKVLVLDAVRTGSAPGTRVLLDGMKLSRRFFSSLSSHQIGLRDIVSASQWLGGPASAGGFGAAGPDEILILGIEPASTSLSAELSPPVEHALEGLLVAAIAQLEAWGVRPRRRRAVKTAAWPSASPPSLGGTAR